jgi:hypothetical protein
MIGELGAAFSKTFGRGKRLRRVKAGNRVPEAWNLQMAGSFPNPSLHPRFLITSSQAAYRIRPKIGGQQAKKARTASPTLCSLRDELRLWPTMLINKGQGTLRKTAE